MARPLRFRYAPGRWDDSRITRDIFQPLDANLGAEMGAPWYAPPEGYEARRFDMDNGDTALFAWTDDHAYWIGNTETPSSLWRTDKEGFDEAPFEVSRWAQRELIAELFDQSPWLKPYPHLSWFFLPVFLSKDGRETTREFFYDHAAGFPDATREEALEFYESFFATGVLDEYREVMAGKLGTSEYFDPIRMAAAMGEFDVAYLLDDAGYDITPEIAVTTGHSIDFRAENTPAGGALIEVTRPLPPNRRSVSNPIAAIRDTAQTKTNGEGQLAEHGGGVTLFVDCSSFPDDDWSAIMGEKPDVRHRPAVVFRLRPSGQVEGYSKGSVPVDLPWLAD
ncbi:hypothetical protein DEQ92_08250 [Haloferax sp. Atlit-6N]|uniref:Uncharacterized protein n=1 Tax=Haloferax gibbonsii (strain ATCC 33959 / DSM 4427 / JCM 8863 / NBRC 102184 / NCIMB 2188 / Ma 2.38) TaxID=1227459 RepID=M0HJU8_HALGM|nr:MULTISPECIES: DUF5784 family protein [Haloferax]ELZ84048.1 hypothetical protein C454_07042 [Haloferax gibbonsii ATCC 33959]REA06233.1 hypothetical protein DEQ92_08250 [Haloferax sp. Atlit-6N]